MLSPREQALAIIGNEPLYAADAIVLLQGDGLARVPTTAALYQLAVAKRVVISGAAEGKQRGSFSEDEIRRALIAAGVPESAIEKENTSTNTREQAVHVFALAKKNTWQHIVLVASAYHQYRAFLTFLQEHRATKSSCDFTMATATPPWFTVQQWGSRVELLNGELKKIDEYGQRGHVASFDEALVYLKEKAARFKNKKPIVC